MSRPIRESEISMEPKAQTAEKRALIRQTAFREFRDRGYHATSIDAICKAAGTSKGSFYWHYASKQEVFIDILETWSREVVTELTTQFEASVEGQDHFASIALTLQREARRGRSIVPLWLEFAVWARESRELQVRLARFFKQIRESIASILSPLVAHRLTLKEQEALATTIFGAYSGLIIQELCDPVSVDSELMVGRFLRVLSQGMSPPKSPEKTPPHGALQEPPLKQPAPLREDSDR